MKRSTDRILTTHTGSLPRPGDLVTLILDREQGEEVDPEAFNDRVRTAVAEVVKKQADHGIDVVNDGEQGRISYYGYVKDRLSGFGGDGNLNFVAADMKDHPDFLRSRTQRTPTRRPACIGPISFVDHDGLARDIETFRLATDAVPTEDRFMSAAGPGIVTLFIEDRYYNDHEAYLYAVADAMKTEYDAIAAAGFVLQLDCPDLALGRNTVWQEGTIDDFRTIARLHVEAINHATRDIPEDQLRMHLCWGNYEGPHHKDVPFRDILDIVLAARPSAISFEAANPRHEWEWAIWEDAKLPDGKLLIPGVLDSTTNFIEHPELIAQRLANFARLVGRENVLAGTDCGFSTGAGSTMVVPSITWSKFDAMAEGARIASSKLW